MSRVREFQTSGCLVLDRFVEAGTIDSLRAACEPLLAGEQGRAKPGVRRVLHRAPEIERLVRDSAVVDLIREFAGEGARIVRSILFDKTPETNWLVPWHQDATIAVRERRDVEGFGPWSVKDGEAHCRPPRAILDSVLVLRVHLDAVGPTGGPLRVIPGSHAQGLLSGSEVDRIAAESRTVECCTDSGGVVLMRPHSIHASPKAQQPSRRRVLHLECTTVNLPHGLEWAEGVPL